MEICLQSDRGNKEKAVASLKETTKTLQSGISIIIAPEGTRSYDYTLGTFKKGAFHLAMQAVVPIVPIVIINAHDVMPRGTAFLRSTAVEIRVLDPISTKGWNKKNMNKKIEEVRQLFLNELGQ